MANHLMMIPFILHFEASTRLERHTEPDRARCRQLFEWARRQGWADDASDRGGATMCGVTLATYRTYCRNHRFPLPGKDDLRKISFDTWEDIFRSCFWNIWKADLIESQRLAEMLVDWVWGSGMNGIRIPQRMLGVKADGIVGEETLTALHGRDPDRFTEELRHARLEFIENIIRRNPGQKKWREGWRRRIYSCR